MSRNQLADKKRLLAKLEKTPIIEAAWKAVGLPRSTYYRWRKDDPGFAEECDETIELSIGRINDLAESQLINAIKDQNMTAITFWLKHHKQTYQTRVKLDGRVSLDTGELTAEQSAMVEKALKLSGMLMPEGETDEQ